MTTSRHQKKPATTLLLAALVLGLVGTSACKSEGSRMLADWQARSAAHASATFERPALRLSREVTPTAWGPAVDAVVQIRDDAVTRGVLEGLLGARNDGGPPVPITGDLEQPYREVLEQVLAASQNASGRSPFAWGDARLADDGDAVAAAVATKLTWVGSRSRLMKALRRGATDSGAIDGMVAALMGARDLARGGALRVADASALTTLELLGDLQRVLQQPGWSAQGLGRLGGHLGVALAAAPSFADSLVAEGLAREAAFVVAHGGTAPPGSRTDLDVGAGDPASWRRTVEHIAALERATRAAGELGSHQLLDALTADGSTSETPALAGSPFVAHAVRQLCAQQAVAAAIVVTALRRHAVVHGALPEDTALLKTSRGEALPPNPFTGKPIGYSREAPGAGELAVTECAGLGDGVRPEGETGAIPVIVP